MPSIGVSESTFQFGFLLEFVSTNWNFISGVPVIPSTRIEAKVGGWDAKIPMRGIDYYYQFKMPYYFKRKSKRICMSQSMPCFMFEIYDKQQFKQHNDLCRIANSLNNLVFYVAPKFKSYNEYEHSFYSSTIINNSKFIPLSQCTPYSGTSTNSKHYISYDVHSSSQFLQCSDPKKGIGYDGESAKEIIINSMLANSTELSPDYFRARLDVVQTITEDRRKADNIFINDDIAVYYFKYMLLNFGLITVIIGTDSN